jgi:hypothetical protein
MGRERNIAGVFKHNDPRSRQWWSWRWRPIDGSARGDIDAHANGYTNADFNPKAHADSYTDANANANAHTGTGYSCPSRRDASTPSAPTGREHLRGTDQSLGL